MGEYRGHVYVNTNSTPYGIIAYRDATGLHTINAGGGGGGGVTDHGALTGLGDDDHSQYLNATRAGTWHGTLSGAHVTNGNSHNHTGGAGAQIDHGSLSGLGDDDHSQYQKTSEKNAASGYAGLNSTTQLNGDHLPAMSTGKKGGVPATGTPSNKFLRDDATWQTPGGGGLTIESNKIYGRPISGALFMTMDGMSGGAKTYAIKGLSYPDRKTTLCDEGFGGQVQSGSGATRRAVRDKSGRLHTVYDIYGATYSEIHYAYSDDDGKTWTEGTDIHTTSDGYSPTIAIDDDENLHVVWGDYSGTERLRYSTSTDGGAVWSSPITIATDATANLYSYNISIICRTNGYVHVIYSDQTNVEQAIWNTSSWSTGVSIATPATNHQLSTVQSVYDRHNDIIHVVYTDYDTVTPDFDIYHTRSVAGASWTTPANVGEGYDGTVAVDKRGDLHLVFWDNSGTTTITSVMYYRKWIHSSTAWNTALELETYVGVTSSSVPGLVAASISVGYDDVIHLLYRTAVISDKKIFYARKAYGEEWSIDIDIGATSNETIFSDSAVCSMIPCTEDELFDDDVIRYDPVNDEWKSEPMHNREHNDEISYAVGTLGSDTAMSSSNTFYNGPSITLPPGTWLVHCHMTHYRNTTTAAHVTARIRTSAGTNYASQQQYHESLTGITRAFHMSVVITIDSPIPLTVYGQMATSSGSASAYIASACPNNSSGTNASMITAIRLKSSRITPGGV